MYLLTGLKESLQNSINQISKALEPVTVPVAKEISVTVSSLKNVGNAIHASIQVVKSSTSSLINGAQSAWNFLGGVVSNGKGAIKDVFNYGAIGSADSYKAADKQFLSSQQHFVTSIKGVVGARDSLVLAWNEAREAASHAKNAANFGLQALSATPGVARELCYLAGVIKQEDQSNIKKAVEVRPATVIRLATSI